MKLLFLVALISGFFWPIKSNADLGEAVLTDENYSKKEFDAWCGKVRNDCKVYFLENGISVNKSNPVGYQRIIDYSYDLDYPLCNHATFKGLCSQRHIFDIYYFNSSGEESTARFIFANKKVAKSFTGALKKSLGISFNRNDPRCENRGEIYYEGSCMPKGTAKRIQNQRTREGLQDIGDFVESERNFRLKERELDIKNRDAMTPDIIQNNQLNIQQNLQQNNF